MGLFDKLLGKKKLVDSVKKEEKNNSFGDSLDHLEDGELPWGWYYAKQDFIKPRDEKLYELSAKASKVNSIDEEIECLEKLIKYYNEYKDECFSKDECFQKYFTDMHMKCHNSRNSCFEFVEPNIERLNYIKANYHTLLLKEKQVKEAADKKRNLLKNLDSEIMDAIKNNPNIIQSDLYKMFDPLLKDDISEKIYFWAKDGKIKREKSGRSYKLILND